MIADALRINLRGAERALEAGDHALAAKNIRLCQDTLARLKDEQLEDVLNYVSDSDLIAEIGNRGLEDDVIGCRQCREREEEDEADKPRAVSAERAYYAMHRGDHSTIREFVLEQAGRIA